MTIDDPTVRRFIAADARKNGKEDLSHIAKGERYDWFIVLDGLNFPRLGCRSHDDGRTYVDTGSHDRLAEFAIFDDAVRTFAEAEAIEIARDRELSYDNRDPITMYGEEIGNLVNSALEELAAQIDHEHDDNHRWAEIGVVQEETMFERSSEQGCCGSLEKTVLHNPTGRMFRVGINYGH